jgi:NADH:ubiquinone oxidoreductase subunit 6 (subunit J)
MYDLFFYIFSGVIILTAFIAAFSENLKTAIHASLGAFSGFAGLMILLNSELYSLLLLLILITAVSLYSIFFPKLSLFFDGAGHPVNKSPFIYIVIAGLVTALLASLVSSTRWWALNDTGTNTFILLFTKYFPVLVLLLIGFSVLISSAAVLIRTENIGGDQ